MKQIGYFLAALLISGSGAYAQEPREIKFVVSGNEAFSLKIVGFMQARLTANEKEVGTNVQTYDIPLARLAFKGTAFTPNLTYGLQFQASTLDNSNALSLLEGWMAYSLSEELAIRAGRFLLPYSRQFYVHPGELLFADISGADAAFTLARSSGIEAAGRTGRLGYHLASVNSVRALDAGGQKNHANHLAYLARLEVDLVGSYGYIESLPKAPAGVQASIGVAGMYNPVASASSLQNVVVNDTSTGYTVDGGLRWNRLNVQAAHYARRTTAHGTVASDDTGFYAQLGYFVCAERWELAGRYSSVNFDVQRNAATVGDSNETTIGSNYYFQGHNLKVQMDYTWMDVSPFGAAGDYQDRQFRLQGQFLF